MLHPILEYYDYTMAQFIKVAQIVQKLAALAFYFHNRLRMEILKISLRKKLEKFLRLH
jgi:hypothetical protein